MRPCTPWCLLKGKTYSTHIQVNWVVEAWAGIIYVLDVDWGEKL